MSKNAVASIRLDISEESQHDRVVKLCTAWCVTSWIYYEIYWGRSLHHSNESCSVAHEANDAQLPGLRTTLLRTLRRPKGPRLRSNVSGKQAELQKLMMYLHERR